VTVEGVRHVQRPFALRIFGIAAGRPLRMEEMLRALDAVYATRLFASNWLEFRPGAGETVVVVLHVEEAPRRRLEAGAAYNESDRVKGFARVRDLNLLGWGERLELEGFASDEAAGVEGSFMGERLLGSAAGYLLQGRVLGERPRFFEDGQDLGRAGFHRRELAGVLQRQLGPALLVRAGAALGTARVGRRPDLPFGPRDDRVRMLRAAAVWDRLDDASLPTSGARVEVMADRSLRGLGATAAYSRLRARGQWVLSLARRSVLELRASMAVSGGAVPAYDLFRLGGPRELPGFRRDELWGAQAGAVSLSHSLTVARGLRLLVRGGAGDVWDSREQIALRGLRRGAGVGLELPTRAGPISLEWARRSGGGSAVYFAVGFE
jgi:outer membrane protein assembly factor BamA